MLVVERSGGKQSIYWIDYVQDVLYKAEISQYLVTTGRRLLEQGNSKSSQWHQWLKQAS